MAPPRKVTKSQHSPKKNISENDLLFLWAYVREILHENELPAGIHQRVAETWGVSKNAASKRYQRMKQALEVRFTSRQGDLAESEQEDDTEDELKQEENTTA